MYAADLFGGCGGLTHGLKSAGFDVRCAVEIDKLAAESFSANHPETDVLVKDIRDVTGAAILESMPNGRVDLVAGCAPCQGFCSLTKNGAKDPRNSLLLEMGRVITSTRPRAVLMENVPGLLDRGRHIFRAFLDQLERDGYSPNYKIVQMADFGVPQYRRRLVLVAARGFVPQLPIATHSRKPTKHQFVQPWVTVRDSIGRRTAPVTFSASKRKGGPNKFDWHVVRDLQPQTKARLRSAIPGSSWSHVEESLRPKCHQGDFVGFTNVYGRMHWDEVSPTITAGCTTVAKGRFGHPDRRRYTISVREAATLQSFPESYRFVSPLIDRVCEQIGNAVPPLYAEHVGKSLMRQIVLHEQRAGRNKSPKQSRR